MGSASKHKGHNQYAFEKGLFINESQEIIKQYLRFNLNENHDDDESDCIMMMKVIVSMLMT